MLHNGARLAGVQVVSPSASTRSGRVNLPRPDPAPGDDEWAPVLNRQHDALAVVVIANQRFPLVIGFIYPQINQLAMPDDTRDLAIDRHVSDFTITTDENGVHCLRHPSGTCLVIGGTDAPDFDGADFDGEWKIDRNTDPAPIRIYAKDADLRLMPNGDVLVSSKKIRQTADEITMDAPTVTATADQVNITAPVIGLNGNVAVTGDGGAGNFALTVGNMTVHATGSITYTSPSTTISGPVNLG